MKAVAWLASSARGLAPGELTTAPSTEIPVSSSGGRAGTVVEVVSALPGPAVNATGSAVHASTHVSHTSTARRELHFEQMGTGTLASSARVEFGERAVL